MKTLLSLLMAASIVLACAVGPGRAEVATETEALNMARNWVTRVIHLFGSWGGSPTSEITGIQPFMRGERQLGYFCPVSPHGYLVVSLHKELAPVKAYSETDALNPASDEGMADVIKGGLERMMNAAESATGGVRLAAAADLSAVVEIDYGPVWKQMAVKPSVYSTTVLPALADSNYQEGQVILASAWHQYWPYNDQCPNLGCTDPDLHSLALVGCVATAAGQIMRHWGWPPYGSGGAYADTYDWPNIPNRLTSTSTAAQINATAELNHEIGVACSMDYGCSGSSAYHSDMVDAYEDNYRFSTTANIVDRNDYTASEWFTRMKNQFNVNRPVQYGIPGHSLVGDGWRESGDPLVREYHFNYGWQNTSYNTWYILDAMHGGDPDTEEMIEGIKPIQALGSTIGGAYTVPALPYRYFDQDATCAAGATFSAGHNLQFLHNITLECTSAADPLRINGTTADNTRLFTRGDPSRGVLISGAGALRMTNGGTIVFR